MIILRNMSKMFRRGTTEKLIFDDVSLEIPGDKRIAVLGQRGCGKTSFLHMLAGLERPTAGKIERYSSISLPIGYSRTFKPLLTCRDNVSFLARCYGVPVSDVVEFVREVADVGKSFDMPMRMVEPDVRLRVVFAVGYGLPFDTYLVDNAFAAGSQEFKEKCQEMLVERAKSSGIIFATVDPRIAKRYCESAILISDNKLTYFPDLEEATWNLSNMTRSVV